MNDLYKQNSINKVLSKQLWRKPSVQLSIVFSILAIGIFTSLSYSNFLHLQSQNIDKLSVFNEIIKPLSGVVLLLSLIIGVVTASQLSPYFFSRGQQSLLQQMSLTTKQFFVLTIKLHLKFVLIPFVYFIVISLFIEFNSHLDLLLFFITCLFLLVGVIFYTLMILTVSLYSQNVIVSILVSFMSVILIVSLDQVFMLYGQLDFLTIFNKLFLNVRNGSASSQELIHLITWLLFSVYMLFIAIDKVKRQRNQSAVKMFFIGVIVVAIFLKLVAVIIPDRTISTSSISNSQLPEYYQNQLRKITNKIEITAVVDNEESKDEIRYAIIQLKKYTQQLSVNFSNRQAFAEAKSGGRGRVEEFVSIKIGNKQQVIRYPFANSAYISIAKLIDHIESKSEQWITFIQGHDEVSIFSRSARSFSDFYAKLKSLGFPIIEQNLRVQKIISNNTKLVVIADSKQQWLADEVSVLMQYLKGGGNLLIMREAKDQLPEALEKYLGVTTHLGTLIDKNGFASGTPHPAILIVNQFNQHSINQSINSLVAFPWSVGLSIDNPSKKLTQKSEKLEVPWKTETILVSDQKVWNDIDFSKNVPLSDRNNTAEREITFDASTKEQKKSHLIMIGLERNLLSTNKSDSNAAALYKNQRVIVVGDSTFISNTAINNYANLQLGINMINWLLTHQTHSTDALLEHQYQDNFIRISPVTHFILNWFFSLIFPFLFLLFLIYQRIKESKQ